MSFWGNVPHGLLQARLKAAGRCTLLPSITRDSPSCTKETQDTIITSIYIFIKLDWNILYQNMHIDAYLFIYALDVYVYLYH